jgi:hypothetical protein
VPRRYAPDCRTRLMRLGDDRQLRFHTPASAALPPVDDLDRDVASVARSEGALLWSSGR